jgi:hypothetical protein
MMKATKVASFVFILLILPSLAWASGGGPLLLFFHLSVFIIGQIWVITIEFSVFWRLLSIKKSEIFWDVFSMNIYSTLVIALGIPLILAGLSAAFGYIFQNEFGELIMALGTWVYQKPTFGKLPIYMSFFWSVGLFVLSVHFEAYILRKRWAKRDFASQVGPVKLCWISNTVSYAGLLIAILVIWREFF